MTDEVFWREMGDESRDNEHEHDHDMTTINLTWLGRDRRHHYLPSFIIT